MSKKLNIHNISNIISFKYNNSICNCKKCNKSKLERETNLNFLKTFKNLSFKIRISYSNNSGKFNLIGGIYKPNELHYIYWYSLTENYEGNNI